MSPFDKEWFPNTMFKRLWHQRYKGRFGAFRWPTYWGFDGLSLDGDALFWHNHFDGSEQRAWNSANGLYNLLKTLALTYKVNGSNKVRLYGHSMGNVVAAEALRISKSNNNSVVHTYVSAQAALACLAWDNMHGYYSMGRDKYPKILASYWKSGAGDPFTWNNQSYLDTSYMPTGTIYVNHYNKNDYALRNWITDQKLKPDFNFDYSSSTHHYQDTSGINKDLDWWLDRYRIFSYAAPSNSFATGASADTVGLFGVNKLDLEVYGFDRTHKYHSGQFRVESQEVFSYWEAALEDMGL